MSAPNQFNKQVSAIENFYPIVTDVQIFQLEKKTCANCESTSTDSKCFVNPKEAKTLCIICDEFGVFVCQSCGRIHRHESQCVFFVPNNNPRRLLSERVISTRQKIQRLNDAAQNLAIRVGRIEQLQKEQERDLAFIGAVSNPVCDHDFTNSDLCRRCGLELPF